ncbi:MAG: aldehyde dehydrogenase [Halieaceae bacterium]|nr:MAG: aldehyde dehydrogenase [Halieaceae bacterium]|tara:strand:+ start:1114 stop:2547 length:1434 start_codon:yes stop_codon:yes gene_type:complete
MDYPHFFIDGAWREPKSDRRIAVECPANREIVGSCPEAVQADVDAAVSAASAALGRDDWAGTSGAERAGYIDALSDAMKSRAMDLANCAVAEIAAPISFSKGQVAMARMTLKFYAQLARDFVFEEQRKGYFGSVIVRKEPVGVVAAIVPFNGPLFAAMLKLGPALASGSTVVLKVPMETPLFSYVLAECIVAAGFPAGVINILPADREVSEYLVDHADVSMVSITGSVVAGRSVAKACGSQIKRSALELGGKSAAIVCEDADPAQIVPALANASVINSGQACAAQTRILIPQSRYEEYVAALATAYESMNMGDPANPVTELGPMIHERHFQRVKAYIQTGLDEGARLVTGGQTPAELEPGYFIQPTLLADVSNDMRVAREEIFGPVVCAIPYDDIDDAIRIANDSDMGLSGSVWTSDVEAGLEIGRRIHAGNFSINGFTMDVAAPFGGYKRSGLGRELGEEGLHDYLEFKTINLPSA